MAVDDALAIVLEEARATMRQQQADLHAVRSQSSAVLSFAGLAAAFVGGLALRDDAPLSRWTYASAASFALVALCATFTMWPRVWIFSNDAAAMLRWDLKAYGGDDTARHLATFLAQNSEVNSPKLARLTIAYSVGLVALVAELAFLFLDLAAR